ncbi:hypothetical protein EGW08_009150 [Elysia chlorotica]|uniref:G-protein coupled receptors family 1 profile domain-containing protein n=1 Tax=Elysia chlorotica TaxID=188477 RepID=A0A433TNA7_ELYCH|nr:hypothetical protein EGW08_009150 [Elysia chlorotica]
MMTPARSLCWICFSWVVVISFCCPPLFSLEASIFDDASYICMIDTKQQIAYVMTAGALVCTPSVVTTVVTGRYLFTKSFKKQIQFYEKVFVDLSSRPWNYHITFTMSVVFFGVWFPFTCVNIIIKYFLDVDMDRNLLFVLSWLGISTGFSQFIVLFLMSPDFRRALKELMRFPEFCRQNVEATECVRTEYGIEARYTPPPAYLNFFEKQHSLDRESSDVDSSPSFSKGAGERRKQSQRSGTYVSGSTSTGSLPFVDAVESVTGTQHRGVSSASNSPARV